MRTERHTRRQGDWDKGRLRRSIDGIFGRLRGRLGLIAASRDWKLVARWILGLINVSVAQRPEESASRRRQRRLGTPHERRVTEARTRMQAARLEADRAAADYRAVVAQAVDHWKRRDGLSIRRAALRLGLSEGALRDLLRPPGRARRAS